MPERHAAGRGHRRAALALLAVALSAAPAVAPADVQAAPAAPASPAAAVAAATPTTVATAAKAAKAAMETRLVCQATYQPSGQLWVRRVAIAHDDRRVTAVRIDGVPVYSFAIAGTLILTALDNERIQIDTAAQSWRSDFRGVATAQGWCEREPG